MSSKFHLSKLKRYFSQFIDKYLKIEEVKYLIYYVKFKIWPALFYVNSLFSKHFRIFVLCCTLFSPIYREIDNWDFECCSRLDFSIFPMVKEIKKLEFSRLGLAWEEIVDQYVLLTHLHLIQGEKIEAWFVFKTSREYYGIESTAILSASIFTKKSTHW